jgi:hypothetical protein
MSSNGSFPAFSSRKSLIRHIIIVLFAFGALSASLLVYQNYYMNGKTVITTTTQKPTGETDYGLYVYLFKLNPSLDEHPYLEYMRPLSDKVYNMTGLSQPTFEEAHYSVSREGAYSNVDSGRKVDRISFVKFIISNSIRKPDGSQLVEDDIVNDTRFYYSGLGTARLVTDKDGKVYSYNQGFPSDALAAAKGDQRVFTLFVQAPDYQKVSSKYNELKNLIESFELNNAV